MIDDEPHPVDTTVTAAIDAAQTRNTLPSPNETLAAARGARNRQARRRRNRVRVTTLGAAAAMLLVVVGVAMAVTGDGDTNQVASGGQTTATYTALLVEPSTNLANGQQVTVHVASHDIGEPVRIAQCRANEAGDYTCSGSSLRTIDGPSGPTVDGQRTVSTTMTVHPELDDLFGIDVDASGTPTMTVIDPVTPTVSCTDGTAQMSPGRSPCVIAALVPQDGLLTVHTASLSFKNNGSESSGSTVPPAPGQATPPASSVASTAPPSPDLPVMRNAEVCPTTIPPAPSLTGIDRDAPLVDFAPTKIVICTYGVSPGVAPGQPTAVRTVTDGAEIDTMRDDLNDLGEVPDPTGPDAMGCTAEKSSDFAIIASAGARTETIWAQHYGCGYVFDGDRMRLGAKTLTWLTG